MKAIVLPVLSATLVASLPVQARTEVLGDARAGQAYAEKFCSECHAVSPGAGGAQNPEAPSFASVANSEGMSERALGVWFQTSHPTMPNFVIPRKDLDDVIAYIMSLKADK